MRKLLALLMFGCAALSPAQVIGINPTPMAVYYWNTSTSEWTKCPNSSAAEPFPLTPQAFAQYGFNSGLGQWTPQTTCPGSGGGGGGTITMITTSGYPSVLGTLTITNPTTTPALIFAAPSVASHTVLGNFAGSSGIPTYGALTEAMLPFTYSGTTSELATASGAYTSGHGVVIDANGNLVDAGSAPGGGMVQPAAQYHLYMQPNSGTQAVAGPSNLLTDSTGNNLTVPGALGVSGTLTDTANNYGFSNAYPGGASYFGAMLACAQASLPGYAGGGFGDNSCGNILDKTTYPGSNCGFPGAGSCTGWFIHTTLGSQQSSALTKYFSGIYNGTIFNLFATSEGDINMSNINSSVKPAWIRGGDEGVHGGGRNSTTELDPLIATVATGGTGVNTLTYSCTANCQTLGIGHPIVDLSSATSGSATSIGSAGLAQIEAVTVSGFTVTPSITGATTVALIDVPAAAAGSSLISASVTFQLTGLSGAVAGTPLVGFMAPASTGDQPYYEVVQVTPGSYSGGTQSFTGTFHYPHAAGTKVMIGGPVGEYIEFLNGTNALFDADIRNSAANAFASVTAYSINTNVITLTTVNHVAVGSHIYMLGFGTSTFLNNQTLTVTAATGTTLTAAFTHANASATEAGYAAFPIRRYLENVMGATSSSVLWVAHEASNVPFLVTGSSAAGGLSTGPVVTYKGADTYGVLDGSGIPSNGTVVIGDNNDTWTTGTPIEQTNNIAANYSFYFQGQAINNIFALRTDEIWQWNGLGGSQNLIQNGHAIYANPNSSLNYAGSTSGSTFNAPWLFGASGSWSSLLVMQYFPMYTGVSSGLQNCGGILLCFHGPDPNSASTELHILAPQPGVNADTFNYDAATGTWDFQGSFFDFNNQQVCTVASVGCGTLPSQILATGSYAGTENTVNAATTIAPVNPVVAINGTTPIATITPPAGCTTANRDCILYMLSDIATGPAPLATGGNIAYGFTPLAGTMTVLTYNPVTSLWYPQPQGFANPMTTLGDAIYGGASGAATRLAGPTTAGTYFYAWQPSGSAIAPTALNANALFGLSGSLAVGGGGILVTGASSTVANDLVKYGNSSGNTTDSGIPAAKISHPDYWSVQSALFSITTAVGPVYYEPAVGSVNFVQARLSGTISCTVAPNVSLLDLGTSPTTSYGSATVIASLPTGTSDGVYNLTTAGANVAAGHYLGIGFASGTCVTAPQFDITASIQ